MFILVNKDGAMLVRQSAYALFFADKGYTIEALGSWLTCMECMAIIKGYHTNIQL